ncbi:MAG: hypothetical protein KDD61_15760 [Bdellovibrionales bacterium]|nr:hypothetical protein [Bdellovibrionales bacterium]
MVSLILAFISVFLFSFSARKLLEAITRKIGYFEATPNYSRSALILERKYKIFAWGCLTLILFYSFLLSFYEIYSTI